MNKKQPNVHLITDAFRDEVARLRLKYDTVVETGTHDGSGSTQIFVDNNYKVRTCECDIRKVKAARERFLTHDVDVAHAYTTYEHDLDPIYVARLDAYDASPSWSDEQWLDTQIQEYRNSVLYFLDSHWTMGIREFLRIIYMHQNFGGEWTILLDDAINHKHNSSIHYAKSIYKDRCKVHRIGGERWARITLLP
jgi:hypothetical protein